MSSAGTADRLQKYYVIPCNGGELVYPIKARMNPYKEHRPAYCGGLPHFFGGSPNARESYQQALRRETGEESWQKCQLTSVYGIPFFFGTYIAEDGRTVECRFFYSTIYSFNPTFLTLSAWSSKPPISREMCCTSRIPLLAFGPYVTQYDVSRILLENARNDSNVPQWAKDQMPPALNEEYCKSLYFRAFACLIEDYFSGKLHFDQKLYAAGRKVG